jgi:hypothetical protein
VRGESGEESQHTLSLSLSLFSLSVSCLGPEIERRIKSSLTQCQWRDINHFEEACQQQRQQCLGQHSTVVLQCTHTKQYSPNHTHTIPSVHRTNRAHCARTTAHTQLCTPHTACNAHTALNRTHQTMHSPHTTHTHTHTSNRPTTHPKLGA